MPGNESSWPNILDCCLSQIQSGQTTIEECLRRYPEYAQDLLLNYKLTIELTNSFKPASPTEIFRKKAKLWIIKRVRVIWEQRTKDKQRSAKGRSIRYFTYAFAALLISIGAIFTCVEIARASGETLPGDGLFAFKRGVEEIRLLFSWEPFTDAKLLAQSADRRLDETRSLLATGRIENINQVLMDYVHSIDRLIKLVSSFSWVSEPDKVILPSELAPGNIQYRDLLALRKDIEHHLEALYQLRSIASPECAQHIASTLENGQEVLNITSIAIARASGGDIFGGEPPRIATPESSAPSGAIGLPTLYGTLMAQRAASAALSLTQDLNSTDEGCSTPANNRVTLTVPGMTPRETEENATAIVTSALPAENTPSVTPSPSATSMEGPSPEPSGTVAPYTSSTPEMTATATVLSLSIGDVNGDGQITHLDAEWIREYLAGQHPLTLPQKKRVNVVADYLIDGFDAQAIDLFAIGKLGQLPLSLYELPSGDVNKDGLVTQQDAVKLSRFIAALEDLSPAEEAEADVIWDGDIDLDDVNAIISYVEGDLNHMPVLPEDSQISHEVE